VVQEYFELPGVSLPHTETVAWAPVSWVTNKGLDRIPKLNTLHADPDSIRRRFGVLGEPLVIGVVLGGLIGLLGFGPQLFSDFGGGLERILTTAIGMGAVMLVLPRMVRILMEGLNPVSRGARTWLNQRFPGRDLYIGLDAALAIGHPAVIATALLLVPVVIALAVVMSFLGVNRMLPFTDLATLPFFSIWAVAWARGNIIRGILNGTVFMAAFLVIGTFLAPATTEIARQANFDIPQGALQISSLDGGGHLVPWLLALPFLGETIADQTLPMLIACGVVVVGSLACYVAFFTRFGLRRPDESIKPYWEAQKEQEEGAQEQESTQEEEGSREPAGAGERSEAASEPEAGR